MQINPAATDLSFLTGVTAHEIGHLMFLGDCSACAVGSSVMAFGASMNSEDLSLGPSTGDTASSNSYGQYSSGSGGGGGDDTCGLSESEYDEWADECAYYGGVILDCSCTTSSPIIIDVGHDGYSLTSLNGGSPVAITSTMTQYQVSWTTAGSQNAFLVLDGNGNGLIDNGSELFGNFTDQPPSKDKNGFLALAVFDRPQNGGNGDGVIDANDSIYSKLWLWIDSNHDGMSQPEELFTLPALHVYSISLDFKESPKTDQYGNRFRYRAKINQNLPSDDGRWAVDVIFLMERLPASHALNYRPGRHSVPSYANLRNDSVRRAIGELVGAPVAKRICSLAMSR